MDKILFFENKVNYELLDEEKPILLNEVYKQDIYENNKIDKIKKTVIYTDGQLSKYGIEKKEKDDCFVYKSKEVFIINSSYIMLDTYSFLTRKHELTLFIKKTLNILNRRRVIKNILNDNFNIITANFSSFGKDIEEDNKIIKKIKI